MFDGMDDAKYLEAMSPNLDPMGRIRCPFCGKQLDKSASRKDCNGNIQCPACRTRFSLEPAALGPLVDH